MRRTRPLRLATTVSASLAALTLVAGCGGGSDDASSGASSSAAPTSTSASASASTSASESASESASASTGGSATASSGPTSSATGAAFAKLSGQEIADTAKATMLTLQAVHYQGTIATSDDSGDDSSSSSPSASASSSGGTSTIKLDIRAKSDGECAGQVGIEGGRVTVLAANGTSYFKADRKFWQAAAGSAADQIIAGIGNKWVLDSNRDFSQFCALDQFLGSLFSSTEGTQYTAQGASKLGGQDVVAVKRTATDDSPSVGYVLTGAQHYLVRISRTQGSQRGQLDFSGFDQDFTVEPPAASDVIDPSTLAGGS